MTNASDALEIASFGLVALFGAWLLVRKLIQLARLVTASRGVSIRQSPAPAHQSLR